MDKDSSSSVRNVRTGCLTFHSRGLHLKDDSARHTNNRHLIKKAQQCLLYEDAREEDPSKPACVLFSQLFAVVHSRGSSDASLRETTAVSSKEPRKSSRTNSTPISSQADSSRLSRTKNFEGCTLKLNFA